MHDDSLSLSLSLSVVIEALSLSLFLSLSLPRYCSLLFEKERALENKSRSFHSSSVLWRQVVHGDETCSTDVCTWKKACKSTQPWWIQVHEVGVALGRVGNTEPFVFSWRKKWHGVVMAPLHLKLQKLPHRTKWLWKVLTSAAYSGLP